MKADLTLVKVFAPFLLMLLLLLFISTEEKEREKTWLEGSLNVTRSYIDRVIALSVRAELDEAKPACEYSPLLSLRV